MATLAQFGKSLAITALLLLAAQTLMQGEESLEPAPARVLILGDSLTKGYGLLPEQAFPALIQKTARSQGMKNVTVLNGGVSGDTTAGGLRRMGWLLRQKVDVLVIALGGNDGLRGIAPVETSKNLQAIIDTARKTNPSMKLLLAGMEMPDNMGKEYVDAFRKTFPTIAEENKIPLIPSLLGRVGGNEELNQPDMIHPNEEGQRVLAENVWKFLKPLLQSTADQTNLSRSAESEDR